MHDSVYLALENFTKQRLFVTRFDRIQGIFINGDYMKKLLLLCLTIIMQLNICAKELTIGDILLGNVGEDDSSYKDIPVMDEDTYLAMIWALKEDNFEKVDQYIAEGRFHPLWNSTSNKRVIGGIYDLSHYTRGYKTRAEADLATDKLIERYRFLISRGDNSSVPIYFGTANLSGNLLNNLLTHNNDRVLKFLVEEYGYKTISEYGEGNMYENGSLRVFKYLFVDSRLLTKVNCGSLVIQEGDLSKRFMTGYDENGIKKWKGFMDYWDELGIEYKHCYTKGSYLWKLYMLDNR